MIIRVEFDNLTASQADDIEHYFQTEDWDGLRMMVLICRGKIEVFEEETTPTTAAAALSAGR